MNTKTTKLLAKLGTLFILPWLYFSCGTAGTGTGTTAGGGGGGGSSSGVTVSSAVRDTSSASASISQAASVSKGVSKADSSSSGDSIIVAKATVETAPPSGTECTCSKLDGTVLDTSVTDSSGNVSFVIPEGESQVIITAKLPDGSELSNIVKVEGLKTGDKVDAGETDPDSDCAFKQVFQQAGFDHAALASKFASGELNPIAMYKTIKEMFGESVSAGTSDVGSSMIAFRNAWREAHAGLSKPPSFFKNALGGDASILSTMGNLIGGIDLKTALTNNIHECLPAFAKTFDSTTFSKYESAGSSAYDSIAKSFLKYKKADLDNIETFPENFRGLAQQAADKFKAGDTSAFNMFTSENGAAVMAKLIGNAASLFSGDYEAMHKLLQKYKFGDISSASALATHAAAIANLFSTSDNASEREAILKDPADYAATLFNKPDVYAASDGATACAKLYDIGSGGGSTGLTSGGYTPCNSSFPCPSGQTCNAYNVCVSNTAAAGGGFGAYCTINSHCGTSESGVALTCQSNSCQPSSTLKTYGVACAANSECISNFCSGGICMGNF